MKNNKGVTLVELLIAIVVLGVVMTIVPLFLFPSFNILRDNSTRVTNNQLAEIMLNDMTSYLREARTDGETEIKNAIEEHIFYKDSDSGDEDFRIIYNENNQSLEIREDSSIIRTLERVKSFSKTGPVESSFRINFIIEDENGNYIEKSKSVFSRNL